MIRAFSIGIKPSMSFYLFRYLTLLVGEPARP